MPSSSIHVTIRFSLGMYTTEENIDYILEKISTVIQRPRDLSPYWPQGKRANRLDSHISYLILLLTFLPIPLYNSIIEFNI